MGHVQRVFLIFALLLTGQRSQAMTLDEILDCVQSAAGKIALLKTDAQEVTIKFAPGVDATSKPTLNLIKSVLDGVETVARDLTGFQEIPPALTVQISPEMIKEKIFVIASPDYVRQQRMIYDRDSDFLASPFPFINLPEKTSPFFAYWNAKDRAELDRSFSSNDLLQISDGMARRLLQGNHAFDVLHKVKDDPGYVLVMYLASAMHEFGHILYDFNFLKILNDDPLFSDVLHEVNDMVRLSRLMTQLEDLKSHPGVVDPELLAKMEKEYYALYRENEEWGRKHKMPTLIDQYHAYAELYADVIALFYTGDPIALSESMLFSNQGVSGFSARTRNFTNDISLHEMESDENDGWFNRRSTHKILALSRAWFFKEFYSKTKTKKEKARLIQVLFKACVAEMREHLCVPKEQREPLMSISKMNEGLKRQFVRQLALH
jgi:hypothetical protein